MEQGGGEVVTKADHANDQPAEVLRVEVLREVEQWTERRVVLLAYSVREVSYDIQYI